MKKKKTPMILHNVHIEKLGYGGIGIGRTAEGKKILVQGGAIPGSIVTISVQKSKKDRIEGRILEVSQQSSTIKTQPAPCKHHFSISSGEQISPTTGCGGCKWQQIAYSEQCKLKQGIILDSFRLYPQLLSHALVHDIIPSPLEFGYRNKIEYSFGDYKTKDFHNQRAVGFHKQGQFAQIVDIDDCLLVTDTSRQIFHYIKKLCFESGLPIYNHIHHTGFFRHLVIREGINTSQILINLSIADEKLTQEQTLIRSNLQERFQQDEFMKKHITTFVISQNNGLGDTVYSKQTIQRLLRGDGYIFEKLLFPHQNNEVVEVTYKVSANSFFQTNTLGAQILFQNAFALIGETYSGNIIDLYCGAGSIGIARKKLGLGDRIYGIDIVEDAIVDAQYNAAINGIKESTYFVGKAETILQTTPEFSEGCENADVIIVDPPREGLHKNVISFLENLYKQKPRKLLYISCNPVTLARDLDLLSSVYTPRVLQPVDMFPHTHHIETICLAS